MKSLFYLLISLIILLACNQTNQNVENNKDSVIIKDTAYIPEIVQTSDKTMKDSFFIINIAGTPLLKEAIEQVKNLQNEKHPAGYLWMPDYESLSKKELYSVFIGPFSDMDTCIKYLEVYKKVKPDAYAVKVQHNKDRVVINNKFDIRLNDVKQLLILTYSTPEDEKKYAEDGGEDWAWFTYDVQTYFNKNYHGKVIFETVYYSWFSAVDIKQLKKELNLEGFGYILIKGKEKSFLAHNLSDEVIKDACGFFGLEYKTDSQEQQGD